MKSGVQRAIAKNSNLSEAYISSILKGKKRVKVWDTAKVLARVTGTDCELWLEGTADQIRKELENLEIDDLFV